MTNPIKIKEYEEIEKTELLKDCDLDKLQAYLKCKNLEQALKVTRFGIKAKSWVGIIKYKKYQFQILPKLICNLHDNQYILNNLIYMLSYTKKLDIKMSETTKLCATKNPFIEVLIREYAKSLFNCLKRTTPKKYEREEDNLNYLKGKIKFTENIRYNVINPTKFYCEYDEFSENNKLNQLFLFVSTCLYNISNDCFNKKTLKFIMNYFNDINFVQFDKFNIKKIKLSKNQELFKKSFNLAKMFLENSSIDLSKNKFENITLVWDMNKLFEEFIYEILKKNEKILNCRVYAQKGRKLLVGDTNKKRNTYVDILIEINNKKVVLDTKYKKLETINDFSNTDVFQVSTYCLLHKANHAILLYPQWTDKKPDKEFFLNTDNFKELGRYKIYFKTINLKHTYLEDNICKIIDEIDKILKVIK